MALQCNDTPKLSQVSCTVGALVTWMLTADATQAEHPAQRPRRETPNVSVQHPRAVISRQPATTPAMQLEPPQHSHSTRDPRRRMPAAPRAWTRPLLTSNCHSILCPCVVFSQNKSRLEHLADQGYPHMSRGDSCTRLGFGYALSCLLCLHWCPQVRNAQHVGQNRDLTLTQMNLHGSVRTAYNIKGSRCSDCTTSVFCAPCALRQEEHEIEQGERHVAYQPT